jgi:hypothetical protein
MENSIEKDPGFSPKPWQTLKQIKLKIVKATKAINWRLYFALSQKHTSGKNAAEQLGTNPAVVSSCTTPAL